jgi:hypothetical protein
VGSYHRPHQMAARADISACVRSPHDQRSISSAMYAGLCAAVTALMFCCTSHLSATYQKPSRAAVPHTQEHAESCSEGGRGGEVLDTPRSTAWRPRGHAHPHLGRRHLVSLGYGDDLGELEHIFP